MAHHTKLSLTDEQLLKEHVAFIDGQWVPADDGKEFDVLGARHNVRLLLSLLTSPQTLQRD